MTADELKQFCKERNLTYKELAEKIGMTEGSLKVAITTNKISMQTEASIKLLKENQKLLDELAEFRALHKIIKNLANS
jgi:hypothetical protein